MIGRSLKAIILMALLAAPAARSQTNQGSSGQGAPAVRLDLSVALSPRDSEMRLVTVRYEADRDKLTRFYSLPSPTRFGRLERFYEDWQAAIQGLDVSGLSSKAREDRDTLVTEIQKDRQQLSAQASQQVEIAPFVPFAGTIINLTESQLRMQKPVAEQAAESVDQLTRDVGRIRRDLESGAINGSAASLLTGSLAQRAAASVTDLRRSLTNWFGFYNHYDPMFTWWVAQPYSDANRALTSYAQFLRDRASSDNASAATNSVAVGQPVNIAPAQLPYAGSEVPDLKELLTHPQSEMRGVIQRYQTDSGGGRGLGRRNGRTPTKDFYDNWLAAMGRLNFDGLSRNAQVDYLLLKNRITYSRDRLTTDNTARFVPFSAALMDLTADDRAEEKRDPHTLAVALNGLGTQIEEARKSTEAELNGPNAARAAAASAARNVTSLQTRLKEWYDRGANGGTNWEATLGDSYHAADQALDKYAALLRGTSRAMTAQADGSDIVGQPIGRDALLVELEGEMVDKTPEELIARAEREYAWCEAEMKKASREMGFGDDWRKAVEKVKNDHVAAGDQPYLIRDLMQESIDYIESKDLITVPEVARETLRMEMMSPERQLVNPFFTGGELISVSYPVDSMTQEEKLESMRGNNIDFARATVFHELIPGHNLQGFMSARVNGYRRQFSTPFWLEGWACYWELLLYQEHFPKSPENRVGMLFWRMHRCARIIFSLNFHLGKWTPKQCIDFLVDSVGHERDNATAEVRRSFGGEYSPLYQCGYLVGALQLLALHHEFVDSGKMTDRQFHDAIIQGGSMPIAMVRAGLTKDKLTPDYRAKWDF